MTGPDYMAAAFEDWLRRTMPSGDVSEVQRKFEESPDYTEAQECAE